MTCGDVETLLDAFVDSELPPPMLVAVARHAGTCDACEGVVRRLTGLHDHLVATVRRDAAAVDLSGLWSHVEASIDAGEHRSRWGHRARDARFWAAGLAVAAAAATVLVLRNVQAPQPGSGVAVARLATVSGKLPPNHAYIDRLAGRDVLLRREQKSGTTLIWVNHTEDY